MSSFHTLFLFNTSPRVQAGSAGAVKQTDAAEDRARFIRRETKEKKKENQHSLGVYTHAHTHVFMAIFQEVHPSYKGRQESPPPLHPVSVPVYCRQATLQKESKHKQRNQTRGGGTGVCLVRPQTSASAGLCQQSDRAPFPRKTGGATFRQTPVRGWGRVQQTPTPPP